jgi:hypothetical protein
MLYFYLKQLITNHLGTYMQKIFLSLIVMHSILSAMQPAQDAALKDLDKNQKLAYYLNTLSEVENLTGKVLQLLDQGADVNRRINTRDEAIKMVLQEEEWTPEQIADLASDAELESWTPLMAIAQRNFKPISGLEQRVITLELLRRGAEADAKYHSNNRPEMNDMTARAFAYQSEKFKDFTDTLFDYQYEQWRKEVAQRG